ncbi:uncharacterized protein WCC33_006905 [Rhinophrynus dorsalis]
MGGKSPDDWKIFDQREDNLFSRNTRSPGDRSLVEELPGNYFTSQNTRTLTHPSFEAYYTAVALHQKSATPEMKKKKEEGFNINNGDYFYIDPLLSPGHRVYNCLSPDTQNIFSCFSLNTPPPIMSPCVYMSPTAPSRSSSVTVPTYPSTTISSHSEASSHISKLQNEQPQQVSLCDWREEKGIPCEMVPPLQSKSFRSSPYTAAEAEAVCALLSLSGTSPLSAVK